MTKNKEKLKFPGFPPDWDTSFWRYPKRLTGYWCVLSGSEQKILDFILRQTFGYGKLSDKINSTQFRTGIGENNNGVGLNKKTIGRALRGLEKKGFIWKRKVSYWVNEYGLVMGSKRDNESKNGVKKVKYGVKNIQQGVKNGDKTIKNNSRVYSIKEIERIFSLYQEKICPDSRLTREGKKLIAERLKEYSLAELEKAIDNFSKNNWWMEKHSRNGVEWFFSSEGQIDRFINLQPSPGNKEEKLRRGTYNPEEDKIE